MTRTVDITEATLQAQVVELARMMRYRSAHFRPALTKHGWRTPVQGDGKGFPDTLLLRGNRLVVAELKSDTGGIAAEQQDWLDAFAAIEVVTVHLWRPGDLQTIADILR